MLCGSECLDTRLPFFLLLFVIVTIRCPQSCPPSGCGPAPATYFPCLFSLKETQSLKYETLSLWVFCVYQSSVGGRYACHSGWCVGWSRVCVCLCMLPSKIGISMFTPWRPWKPIFSTSFLLWEIGSYMNTQFSAEVSTVLMCALLSLFLQLVWCGLVRKGDVTYFIWIVAYVFLIF